MSMPLDDAIFWIALTVFGTGLYVIPDHEMLGLLMTAVGLGGVAYSIRQHIKGLAQVSKLTAGLMILTVCAVSLDIYLREFRDQPKTVRVESANVNWPILSTRDIDRWSAALAPFRVQYVSIRFARGDEDLAITINEAMERAKWHVVERMRSDFAVGFVISTSDDVRPAGRVLAGLFEKKFGVRPEMQRNEGKAAVFLTIGLKTPTSG